MEGMDLVKDVSAAASAGFGGEEGVWAWGKGYTRQEATDFHVVAIDYGMKQNILRVSGFGRVQGDGASRYCNC